MGIDILLASIKQRFAWHLSWRDGLQNMEICRDTHKTPSIICLILRKTAAIDLQERRLGDFILPDCPAGWLLICDFYNLTNLGSVGFKSLLAVYLPFCHLGILCLGSLMSLLPHSHTPFLNNRLQKGEICLVEIWQVILLLSLPECFELSLCIAKWHLSLHAPPPHNIITSLATIHQSYLCINERKPMGRKFAFSRTDLKVLAAFAQGHMPLQPPDHL